MRVKLALFSVLVGLFALDVVSEGYGFWHTMLALLIHRIPAGVIVSELGESKDGHSSTRIHAFSGNAPSDRRLVMEFGNILMKQEYCCNYTRSWNTSLERQVDRLC